MVRRTLASLMVLGSLVACAPVGPGGYYGGGPAYGPSYAGGWGAPGYRSSAPGFRQSYGGWGGGYAPSYGGHSFGGHRGGYAPFYGGDRGGHRGGYAPFHGGYRGGPSPVAAAPSRGEHGGGHAGGHGGGGGNNGQSMSLPQAAIFALRNAR